MLIVRLVSIVGVFCLFTVGILFTASLLTKEWDIISVKMKMSDLMPLINETISKLQQSGFNSKNYNGDNNNMGYSGPSNMDYDSSTTATEFSKMSGVNTDQIQEMMKAFTTMDGTTMKYFQKSSIEVIQTLGLKKLCMKIKLKIPHLSSFNAFKVPSLKQMCIDVDIYEKVLDQLPPMTKDYPAVKMYLKLLKALRTTMISIAIGTVLACIGLMTALFKVPFCKNPFGKRLLFATIVLCVCAAICAVTGVIVFHTDVNGKQDYHDNMSMLKAYVPAETDTIELIEKAINLHETKGYSFYLACVGTIFLAFAFIANVLEFFLYKSISNDGYEIALVGKEIA